MGPTAPAAADPDTPAVYVDAGPFSYTRLTGLSRYTAQLTLALARLAPIRFFSEGAELIAPADLDWSSDQDLARWSRRIWRAKRRPLAEPDPRAIGLYCTLRPPRRTFGFEVSVLHDFSPCTVPGTHLESTRRMFGGFFAETLLASDLAVAVSHSTKADAAWLTPFDPARVVVAHSGPSLCVGHHLDPRPVARRPEVGLVVSTLEPRKNARFLLDWFRDSDAIEPGSELWWVGPLGWLTSRRELRRLGAGRDGRRVRLLGMVPDRALCRLYRTAGWSAYPSLYEGFGFPVLDSLRHRTPVLASANSSIREFRSPGLHTFDPLDASSLEAAYRAMRSAGPPAIDPAGLDRLYCWDNVARTLLDAARGRAGRVEPGRGVAAA